MPTPIFVVGAARNGTTSLGNMISASPQVASVEHWLHAGAHESNILRNKTHWKSLSHPDDYIKFLHEYAASDYFRLCRGDLTFHLSHRADDFLTFFLDLMDRFATLEGKKFWITKLDPTFSFHDAELEKFLSLLRARYADVKFVRIRRDPVKAFVSYLHMPGRRLHMRERSLLFMPALVLYVARYVATYSSKVIQRRFAVLDVSFESYVANREGIRDDVSEFLGIELRENPNRPDRFAINSSFAAGVRPRVSGLMQAAVQWACRALARIPGAARFLSRVLERLLPPGEPVSRRLLMYEYYPERLIDALQQSGEGGLLRAIEAHEIRDGTTNPKSATKR